MWLLVSDAFFPSIRSFSAGHKSKKRSAIQDGEHKTGTKRRKRKYCVHKMNDWSRKPRSARLKIYRPQRWCYPEKEKKNETNHMARRIVHGAFPLNWIYSRFVQRFCSITLASAPYTNNRFEWICSTNEQKKSGRFFCTSSHFVIVVFRSLMAFGTEYEPFYLHVFNFSCMLTLCTLLLLLLLLFSHFILFSYIFVFGYFSCLHAVVVVVFVCVYSSLPSFCKTFLNK